MAGFPPLYKGVGFELAFYKEQELKLFVKQVEEYVLILFINKNKYLKRFYMA